MQQDTVIAKDSLPSDMVSVEDMQQDTVIVKDSLQSDMVSVEDCEHFCTGRSQLVRTLPMQNCSIEKVHSLEAATGCGTCENSCRHRRASNPQLEQTLLRFDGVGGDVGRDVGFIICVCLV